MAAMCVAAIVYALACRRAALYFVHAGRVDTIMKKTMMVITTSKMKIMV